MSKGPGELQCFILSEVENAHRPLLLNSLLWRFAEEHRRPASDGELGKALYTSFRRAASTLIENKAIEARTRRLQTLEELIEYYPDRTRSAALRDLRRRLLPRLRSLPSVRGDLRSRFSTSQTEDFLVGNRRTELREPWEQLRTALLAAGRAITLPRIAHTLAHLIVRGDAALLPDQGVKHPRSFVDMANQIRPHLNPSLAEELILFCDEAWPPTQRARVALKSQLYAWADFGANSKPRLKPEARDALLELEPRIVEDLLIKKPTHGTGGFLNLVNRIEHKPLLDQLLQRDALGPFDFLSLPGTVAAT